MKHTFVVCCYSDFFQTLKGYGKILVALGTTAALDTPSIEVIDLDSSTTQCQALPTFPKAYNGAIGGLGPNEVPIICGTPLDNKECRSLINGNWVLSAPLKKPRQSGVCFPNHIILKVTISKSYTVLQIKRLVKRSSFLIQSQCNG